MFIFGVAFGFYVTIVLREHDERLRINDVEIANLHDSIDTVMAKADSLAAAIAALKKDKRN